MTAWFMFLFFCLAHVEYYFWKAGDIDRLGEGREVEWFTCKVVQQRLALCDKGLGGYDVKH